MPLYVLEGIDGCGKSTQVERLTAHLTATGTPPLRLREPGATALGERLRGLLLDPATEACPVAELFTYLAARAQLCAQVIAPALAEGRTILLDRFWYSTVAYQAYGLGLDVSAVRGAIDLALQGVRPDCAIWIEVDPLVALRRRAAARGADDRIEARGLAYQQRVHQGYAALAASGDLIRVDGSADADQVAVAINRIIDRH